MILTFDVHALERVWPKQRRQGLMILLMDVEYARVGRQNDGSIGMLAKRLKGLDSESRMMWRHPNRVSVPSFVACPSRRHSNLKITSSLRKVIHQVTTRLVTCRRRSDDVQAVRRKPHLKALIALRPPLRCLFQHREPFTQSPWVEAPTAPIMSPRAEHFPFLVPWLFPMFTYKGESSVCQ